MSWNNWHMDTLQQEIPTDGETICSETRKYFYTFEFQERGTLHLHMLVRVKDLSVIRANLLHASIPWENAGHIHCGRHPKVQPFLPTINNQPDSFVEDYNKVLHLQLQYTEEDANRNLHAYISSLLGSLRCRTDVKLADGKGMLLKYISSYVTKMHEVATSEGLYCCDVSEFQAAHSFLRTVHLLEPEMIF